MVVPCTCACRPVADEADRAMEEKFNGGVIAGAYWRTCPATAMREASSHGCRSAGGRSRAHHARGQGWGPGLLAVTSIDCLKTGGHAGQIPTSPDSLRP